MAIETTCPQCQALFRLADEMAGKKVKCQKCARVFVVVKPTPKASAPIDMEIDDKPAEAPIVAEAEATAVTEDEPTGKAVPPPPTRKKQASKSGPRHATPRDVGSSVGMTALLVVLIVGALLSCVGCVGGGAWWYYRNKENAPVAEKKDDDKKIDGNDPTTYTIVNLKEGSHNERRFNFTKGQRVDITVTNQLTNRGTDVDLFVYRGNNPTPMASDVVTPNVSPHCRVVFIVNADDFYRVRVVNLGPGTAQRCEVVIQSP